MRTLLKARNVSAQGSAKASAPDSVTLQGLTAGKSRLEAARWFFEALVLQTKDFVDLQQVRVQHAGNECCFLLILFGMTTSYKLSCSLSAPTAPQPPGSFLLSRHRELLLGADTRTDHI